MAGVEEVDDTAPPEADVVVSMDWWCSGNAPPGRTMFAVLTEDDTVHDEDDDEEDDDEDEDDDDGDGTGCIGDGTAAGTFP